MSASIHFPMPHDPDQPRPDSMPLRLRVVAAGRWPWASDGDISRLLPPHLWRPFGSRLTPSDARGAGIWCRRNFVRLQIGHHADATNPGDCR